jgi:hypothetical protein
MRTAASVLGCVLLERRSSPSWRRPAHRRPPHRQPGLHAAVLVPLQPSTASASRSRPTTIPSAAISCTCCTARPPPEIWVRAMHTSLILYAEHEFNASTFTGARHRRHRLGHVFRHHRRHRRPARAQARRRQRGGLRHPEPLRQRRRGRGRHPRPGAARRRKSSSASATRSIPSAIRATR